MVSFKLLAGGYDVFVATYLFNAATSSLTLLNKSPTGRNPSWIALHPTNRSLLYAVNQESGAGSIQSFGIKTDGTLTDAIDTVSSGGRSPPFVTALSTGSVAVVNYASGTGRIIPTTSEGTKFDSFAPIITFPTPEVGTSHPHMVVENFGEVLVPDLGGDTIWRLRANPSTGASDIEGSIPQPKGSGPRHIAIFNNRLFTLHELSSTLSVQTLPDADGTSNTLAIVSIIPSSPPEGAKWAAAEILIPPPSEKFPVPYIYVSNRNKGPQTPEGDTIAIFEHVNFGQPDEGLVLVNQVYTGLDQIRGMGFGNAREGGDEYLAAAGHAGAAGVIVLQRIDGGRGLQIVARNLDIPTRTSFLWL
ncbi:hypothetical protein GALMADRAFT_253558 [Galerina marginata CBS 339.88]|uniref:Isomerase YbhE n=1 Tax=Galerina marginata (strain CBS 339.88) TaxID=685588 RepID=A0A067SLJ1_GALM3|nr:hypothetical protein GALMADRAFT_253558 [Galerina marginata CBS 339.88]